MQKTVIPGRALRDHQSGFKDLPGNLFKESWKLTELDLYNTGRRKSLSSVATARKHLRYLHRWLEAWFELRGTKQYWKYLSSFYDDYVYHEPKVTARRELITDGAVTTNRTWQRTGTCITNKTSVYRGVKETWALQAWPYKGIRFAWSWHLTPEIATKR